MSGKDERKSISRSLGEFCGHLWQGVTAKPTEKKGGSRHEVRRDVEEEERRAPDGGRVIARRTTIEEVEYEPPEKE